jgi:hypothetical protein
MINDKTLLSVWKENLFTDFKNTLYWEAISWEAISTDETRQLDFYDLQPNDTQFSNRWLRQLTDNVHAKFELSPTPSLTEKIKQLYYESLHSKRTDKSNPLGFGYPLFIQKDPIEANKFMAAPVFIWELNLKQNLENPGDWLIEREFGAIIRPNPLLMYYLKREHQLDLERSLRQALVNHQLSQLSLLKICNEISLKVGLDSSISTLNSLALPTRDELQEILNTGGGIRWSGIVGLFSALNVSTLEIIDAELSMPTTPSLPAASVENNQQNIALPERTARPTNNVPFRQYDFSIISTNPYQSAVVRALDHENKLVVFGGHGTGKTQTAAAIAANLLSNKKKTLIISNHVNSLKAIQNQLDKVGLGELTLLLSSPEHEKESLYEAVYQSSLGAKKLPQYEEEDFQHALNKCHRLGNRLNNAYRTFKNPIFDKANWTEMVGQFYDNQLQEGKHLLNNHLNAKNYQFNKQEFEDLQTKIEQGYDLYSELNTLKHPLRVLHDDIFIQKTHSEASGFTFDTVDKILNDIAALYSKYAVVLASYSEKLQKHFDDYYLHLKSKAEAVKEDIEDYSQQYGEDFTKVGLLTNLRLRALSVFSKRIANVREIKNEVKRSYNDIEGTYENERYFAYLFPNSSSSSFNKLSANLDDFDRALEEWKINTPNVIQQEIERLDKENINEKIEFKAEVQELDLAFDEFMEKLNSYQLYQKTFYSDANTVLKKRRFLEEVTETIETLQYNLRDFDVYYYWTSFWLSLEENQQVLLEALIKTKPNNWMAAFNSWYFHHVLTNNYDTHLLDNASTFEEYAAQFKKIQSLLPQRTLKYWKIQQNDQIRNMKRDNKYMHMVLFAKNRTRFLHEFKVNSLFEECFELMTSMYPAMLMSPSTASEWLPKLKGYFDVVIVDNAERMQTEDAISALWRGNKQVIIGDELQVDKRMNASLMSYAKQIGYNRYYLPLHHGEIDERIWNFKNAAFYNNSIEILPNRKASIDNPLTINKIEGVYQSESRINQEEAEQVMHALNEIEANVYDKFPNIGIICMTKEQRNLVIYYLDQIKNRKVAGNERITRMEKTGLNVYYYRDIQDHQFDVMILSTTFGLDLKNNFSNDIKELNQVEGLQSLIDLMASLGEKTQIITSLPQTYIDHYAKYNTDAKGIHILANLIEYGQAMKEKNEYEIGEICARLYRPDDEKPKANSMNINTFIEKVGERLAPYIEDGRISIHQKIDGLVADILIEPIYTGQPHIVIVSDGSFWRYPKGSHLWETEIGKQLENAKFHYLPIWSVNWWKSPDTATKQLAGEIIRLDQHYKPKPPVTVGNAVPIFLDENFKMKMDDLPQIVDWEEEESNAVSDNENPSTSMGNAESDIIFN